MDWKSGLDPGLGASLHQDAVVTPGKLELLDGFARACACLAEDVDGPARLVLREKGFDLQLIEWYQSCARDMRTDVFPGRADIQQLMVIAGAENRRKRDRRDGLGLDFRSYSYVVI
jgi:hypothetical protein